MTCGKWISRAASNWRAAGAAGPSPVLDDHSRFDLVLDACASTPTRVVRERLHAAFRRYGLPLHINADNGPPWGCPAQPGQLTTLTVWLIRLGIRVSHSRPAHSQTNGKDERFHRTLKAELLAGRHFSSLKSAQQAFDAWRTASITTNGRIRRWPWPRHSRAIE